MDNQIEALIKNIQKGLRLYPSEELISKVNETLLDCLNKKDDKKQYIDYIFELVCNEYSVNKRMLINGNARGKFQQARVMCYCLMHLDLGISVRHISARIFKKQWHSSVSDGIRYYKKLDLKINQHREFNDSYNKIKQQLISKIKTPDK